MGKGEDGGRMQPIIYREVECFSFKQLDECRQAVKGTSFRAFKRAAEVLVEGSDYFYLDAEQEHTLIEALQERSVIYRSTRHLVLLTDSGRRRLERYFIRL